jgi:hypothetical protein
MAKARAGFHGPYGTGINQLFKGMGGPEYIYSILVGYTGEEKEEFGTFFYENKAFPGGWISMGPPLSDDQVTYADGHPATVQNMAEDVSAFLMWAAEPKLMARKQAGFVSVIFLIILSTLLYLTNKKSVGRDQGQEDRLILPETVSENPARKAGFFICRPDRRTGRVAGRPAAPPHWQAAEPSRPRQRQGPHPARRHRRGHA